MDSRFELFDKTSPKRLAMGSALLIEHYTSRTNPVVHYTAGVLCAVVRKGLLTSFTLRHYVAGSGVEVTFKVFSPMIKTIKVLKRIEPEDMIKQYKNKTTSYNSTMASVASKANPSSSSSTTTAASPRGSLSGFLTLPPKPVESNSFRKKRRHLLVSSSATSSENKELKRTVEEDFMRRFTLDPYKPFDMEIIRTHPRLAPVPYSKVDEMVIRERETQKRLAAGEAGN